MDEIRQIKHDKLVLENKLTKLEGNIIVLHDYIIIQSSVRVD